MDQIFTEAPELGATSLLDEPHAADSSQLPRFAPASIEAEVEVYKGLLHTQERHKVPEEPSDITMELPQVLTSPVRSQQPPPSLHDQFPHAQTQQAPLFNNGPRRHKTPDEPSDRAMELPQVFTSPARPQQPASSVYDQFPAQTQQARLFNDPRRYKLFDEYNEVMRQNPDSHLARLGELAHYVFDNGRPARVWTAGGVGSEKVGLDPSTTSIHGKCDCAYDEADILLLTESEHASWSKANNPPKLVVIRDPKFSRRRPAKSTESWLREQEKRTHNKWVDVQRLNRQCNDGAAENIPLADAIQQWRTSQDSDTISLDTPPMNLLNISDKTVGHWPEGLAKDYQLLFEAIDECEAMIYRSLDERLLPLSEQDRGIGKTTLMLFSHSDIQKCTQFRILAHRGACSSWHIDNAGVYTFIVLEANIDSPDEKDEDVVKYWPVFPTHHMNAHDEEAARLAFSKQGINWRPTPKDKIPVIALTRGDMLIQPPGTIHAPITLTNCFFLGGMAWRRSTLPQTLKVWHYLMKNEICTNEPLPRQSQAILDFIRTAVHDAPEDHGYQRNELGEFDKICDEISGMVSKCGCSKACSLSTKCSCLMQGLKCGIRCHKGGALHHSTCTTVNMLSPSSMSGGKKHTKRSRLRDDEDSDYMSNGTHVAQAKKRKRVVETPQTKTPTSTLDATVMQPHAHLNGSPAVAGFDYTPSGTPSGDIKRDGSVKLAETKTLEATAVLPNVGANNSPVVADSSESKRPETCAASSTGGTCEYTEIRGDRLLCKFCGTAVDVGDDASRHRRPRAGAKPQMMNVNGATSTPSIEEGVENRRKCHDCGRSDITVDRKGPNGSKTLCGGCARKWAKAKLPQETDNEAATPAKLLPSIENGDPRQKACGNCRRTGILIERRGPDGPGTLCWTCGKKYSKAKAEREANNNGDVQAAMGTFDEAKSASNITPGKKRETSATPSKSKTSEASMGQPRPQKEDYCLRCKMKKLSSRWSNYEDSTSKGKRCSACYQKDSAMKKRSLGGSKTASPSPAKENDPNVRSGLKLRFSPAAIKQHNTPERENATPQQDPPTQLQSGNLPPSFDAPPGPRQEVEDGAVYPPKTDLPIASELSIAAEMQESAQQDPVVAYPFQRSDPQVLIDLQNFAPHKAEPEQPVEHKLEAIDFMVPEPEPQTLPALAQDSANLNTKPEATIDLPPTNGSTTTESPGENTNSYSSPLSEIDDPFADFGNANLSQIS